MHPHIRLKSDGEAGDSNDDRRDRDQHIVVDVLSKRQNTGGTVRV